MIDLEDHAVEVQHGKLVQRTQTSLDGLRRVIAAIDFQVAKEGSVSLGDSMLQSKRQIAEERTRAIIEGLTLEKERLLFAIEEGNNRLVQFHSVKNSTNAAVATFLHRKETMLTNQKNKWKLRVPEFTTMIIDDLQVDDNEVKIKAVENEMVFHLQEAMKSVLGLRGLDFPTLNKVMAYLLGVEYKSLLLLYYGTQLLAMICDTEQEYLQGKLGVSNWACLSSLTTLIPASLDFISEAEAVADMAVILLPSTIHATRSLLELLYAARYCQFQSQSLPSMLRQSTNFSAKRKSADEGTILRGSRDAWDTHRSKIISKLDDCMNMLQHSFHHAPSEGRIHLSEKSVKGHVTIGTLRSMCTNRLTLVAQVLQCARMIYLSPWSSSSHDSSEQEEAELDSLLSRALKLSALVIQQYSIRLGHVANFTPLSIRDPLYFVVHDHDAIAALDCLAAFFGQGMFSPESLQILQEASSIVQHRYFSFFYATAYLKCIIAGALYYIEHGNSAPAPGADLLRASRQRDPLSGLLSESAEKVMAVCCAHRNSLTICHKGMMAMRLLMTDAFLKRTVIEDLISKPLLKMLDAWICGGKLLDEEDEEEMGIGGGAGGDGKDDDATVATVSTTNTYESSTVQSLGNISTLSGLEPPVYLMKFKQMNARLAFHDNVLPATEMTFVDVIKFACENHSQSSEALEQILLLIDHMANKAHMCKYLLVETGLPLLLQRMLDSRPAELYIAALISLCLDGLDI